MKKLLDIVSTVCIPHSLSIVNFLCPEAYFLFSLVLGLKYLLLKVHVVA